MKPIEDQIRELIDANTSELLDNLPPEKVWGWFNIEFEGVAPSLGIQLELTDDYTADVTVDLDKAIKDNIDAWVRDGEKEEMARWRDLLIAWAAKIDAAI